MTFLSDFHLPYSTIPNIGGFVSRQTLAKRDILLAVIVDNFSLVLDQHT